MAKLPPGFHKLFGMPGSCTAPLLWLRAYHKADANNVIRAEHARFQGRINTMLLLYDQKIY